ncbi:DNA polymerase Y family protein [Microlunatus spumicola]|uniref:DNA polymerase Y family protein n=1 Tax=Microlunatus spumicola TaxID=81499 RepID=A0ABP6YDN9_9ACTN
MSALLVGDRTGTPDDRTRAGTEPPVEDDRGGAPRVMVVWCPDWPVVAAAAELGLAVTDPVAVIEAGEVFACSEEARRDGVRRGMRRRDAAARCPDLVLVDHSPERDVRAFEAVLSAVEHVSATVTPIRPGLCALSVPRRFYGGEAQAAAVVAEHLVDAGVWDCRAGIADGMFTAEQAAKQAAPQESVVVPVGGSRRFLSRLPVAVLDDLEQVSLFRRLGLRTLGDLAALPVRDVATRFGATGSWLHRLARGADARPAVSRQPPRELDARVTFSPGLETIEPIAFSSRRTAESFVAELSRHGLVCGEVRIEVSGDRGWVGSRVWAHPRWFSAADLVDRLYWQLQGDPAPEPVETVRFVPEAVESLADHGEGLWGTAPDERIVRGVARLQGMLGPEQVLTPSLQGGRSPRDRQSLTPWGERSGDRRPAGLPWPGSIPPPAPARVLAEPLPATVLSAEGLPVRLTGRGAVSAEPVRVRVSGRPSSRSSADRRPPDGDVDLVVDAWAGPWPIDELWWDPQAARAVARFQVVAVDGTAWLLMVEGGQWWVEARYE